MNPPDRGGGADPGGPVIALVASTGGVEAVAATLAELPADLAAAVVVLIHQEPDRPRTALSAVLAPRSVLPVAIAVQGAALLPGRVVVVPPGTHLLVTHRRRLTVFPAGSYPPYRPSADLLLASMATALGEDAVAVVMTGQGQDGATGATAVHVHGGTVLATSEASSRAASMPRATIDRDDALDAVVDLGDLAGELVARVGAPRPIARPAVSACPGRGPGGPRPRAS